MSKGLISSHRQMRFHALALSLLGVSSLVRAENWHTETGVRVSETYSDNIGRQPANQARGDWATEVSPYLTFSGQSARSTASVDARFQNWLHTDSQTGNRTGLQLSAFGNLEAYEDFLFIDASLSNDRQRISQFQAANSSYGGTANSTEVTRLSLSPYLRWRLGSSTEGLLRYRYENVQADKAGFAKGQTNSAVLDLHNGTAFGRLGWGFSATHSDADAQTLQATSSNTYSGSLNYALTPALSASLFGGQEFNDYGNATRQHYWNWGAGLKWQPDDRTSVAAQTSKRFFGRGFSYQLSHRMAHSALEWSYSRDLNASTSTVDTGLSLGSVSTVNYLKYLAAYAAVDPAVTNPAERKRLALAALEAAGVEIFDFTKLNYLSSRNVINRSMQLAWVINGARNAVTLAAHTSDMQTVSQQGVIELGDDLARFERVKSRGWDVSWRHDLSALTMLNARYGWLSSVGEGGVGSRTTAHTHDLNLGLTTKLAPYTTAGVSYNYSQSSGSFEYRENAISVNLNHRF